MPDCYWQRRLWASRRHDGQETASGFSRPRVLRQGDYPLRLDVELAKVELEDIYAHVLEIWDANAGKRRHVPLTDKNILYSGQPSDVDVKALIRDFQFHIDAANKVLAALSDDDAHDEPTTRWPAPATGRPTGKPSVHFPPSSWRDRQNRRVDGKFHGRRRDLKHRFAASPLPKDGNWPQGVRRHNNDKKNYGMHSVSFHVLSKAFVPECVRCPPGFWHDSANCPTADVKCDECVIEQADDADGLVSAFQTAFDTEDDTAFARLCAQHDHPFIPWFGKTRSPSRSPGTLTWASGHSTRD
ncbi:hypothetical protein CYMTET_10021 [Cymbomonas tetramitiformis]|uniref:Uncharacterized protein n=1 Tax=Cymbomonas tetramitiformis TaxID=36881 RepID=A0AAE0GQH1_9CHLO|nr:hypothetical protein CYMTET_10021 [Cymbomonas tetramitiformis]